jgi:PAS domain S-box-containing protein
MHADPHPVPSTLKARLAFTLENLAAFEMLFEHMVDTAFFIKDRDGCYLVVNQSLVERVGCREKRQLIGRHVRELFPADLATCFATQDEQVLQTGQPIIDKLERHLYRQRRPGWCLTTKLPLRDAAGQIVGLVGVSRDVHAPGEAGQIMVKLTAAMDFLERKYPESVTPALLARQAGLSPVRFARLIRRIYGLTPRQLITQMRIESASRLLQGTRLPVSEIALSCGFYDQSAFTRAFKATTGFTPTQFRR